MYLTSPQEQHLLSMVKKISPLTDHFDLRERERLSVSLFKSNQVSGVSDVLKNEYQCYLGFRLAISLLTNNLISSG